MEDDNDNEYITCKVVLLGEVGVGKTSIISRYLSNSFSQVLMSTTGTSYATKKIDIDDDHKIQFQIWDTAGQERFRSLAKIFYQSAAVAILVYDITRRDSFEKLKNFWIKELEENAPSDIILAIAGNKSDNYEFEAVTLKEGKELAKNINAIFKSTSAKLAHGIDDLFKAIGQKFFNLNPNNIEPNMTYKEEVFRKNIKINNDQKGKNEVKKKCC